MVLTPHILVGAVIGTKTQNLGLIVALGLASHFILDWLPHWHYLALVRLKEFKKTKSFKLLFLSFLQMGIDTLIGLIIVFAILWYKNILNLIYLPSILFAILIALSPDISIGLAVLFIPERISKKYIGFLQKYLHKPKKEEKIIKEGDLTFLNMLSPVLIVIISCVLLLSL